MAVSGSEQDKVGRATGTIQGGVSTSGSEKKADEVLPEQRMHRLQGEHTQTPGAEGAVLGDSEGLTLILIAEHVHHVHLCFVDDFNLFLNSWRSWLFLRSVFCSSSG